MSCFQHYRSVSHVYFWICAAYKCWKEEEENQLLLHESTPSHPSPSIYFVVNCHCLHFGKLESTLKAVAERMMGNFSHVKAVSLPPFSPRLARFFLCVDEEWDLQTALKHLHLGVVIKLNHAHCSSLSKCFYDLNKLFHADGVTAEVPGFTVRSLI